MSILWNKKVINIRIDISDKEIGDSVKSPISASRIEKMSKHNIFNLEICGLNENEICVNTSNYYIANRGNETQVIFLTGLPAIDGVQLTALILIDNEFTLIGVNE